MNGISDQENGGVERFQPGAEDHRLRNVMPTLGDANGNSLYSEIGYAGRNPAY